MKPERTAKASSTSLSAQEGMRTVLNAAIVLCLPMVVFCMKQTTSSHPSKFSVVCHKELKEATFTMALERQQKWSYFVRTTVCDITLKVHPYLPLPTNPTTLHTHIHTPTLTLSYTHIQLHTRRLTQTDTHTCAKSMLTICTF